VSFVRDESPRPDASDGSGRQVIKWQRAARSDRLADATLACAECDAPVAIGPGRIALTEALACPYCGHSAPVRDFVSLAQPTRATRVVVRVGLVTGAASTDPGHAPR
jgi:DNA-directed RNA polymerase subunit RPC12/RpoP